MQRKPLATLTLRSQIKVPKMSAPKRRFAQREEDLVFIAAEFVKGVSQREIAEKLGKIRPYTLSHKSIGKDVQEVLRRWRDKVTDEIDAHRADQLMRLAVVETEAFIEWERSKKQTERTVKEKTTGRNPGTKAQIVQETALGDPRYLEIALRCGEMRCKLLGLTVTKPVELMGNITYAIKLPDDFPKPHADPADHDRPVPAA